MCACVIGLYHFSCKKSSFSFLPGLWNGGLRDWPYLRWPKWAVKQNIAEQNVIIRRPIAALQSWVCTLSLADVYLWRHKTMTWPNLKWVRCRNSGLDERSGKPNFSSLAQTPERSQKIVRGSVPWVGDIYQNWMSWMCHSSDFLTSLIKLN